MGLFRAERGREENYHCGSFNEDLIGNVRAIAIMEGVTMQLLIGEALELLLRSRGLDRGPEIL